jgi:glycosyltransferase involved in cell wall biosynthesis
MITINSESKLAETTTPLISVAMPVYNGEKYLAEAVDSILAQTFTDFELIIIDDGSTDNSLSVLQAYQKRDSRIRLISRENKNLVATLNEIIDLARGKWVARMDQDDIALPQRFERQLEWLYSTSADISGSWVQRFGTSDRRVVRLSQTDEAVKMEMLFCSPFVHPSVMMRTLLIKRLRYKSLWEKAEDYDLWERAAEAGWKMTNAPEVLLLYRVHKSQISTKVSAQQKNLTLQIQERYWRYFFNTIGLEQELPKELLKIRTPLALAPNMDSVDLVVSELLKHGNRESRSVVFSHVAHLYFRVAADCPDIVARWRKLFRIFGWRQNIPIEIKLWLLRILRINPDDRVFSLLRKIYIVFLRS